MRRRTTAAALAVVVTAGATAILSSPQTASAATGLSASGTLLYIKDHNLWMARGDGSDAVRLTSDGTEASAYKSPSMADNGRFSVARGGDFLVFEPSGALVNAWKPEQLFVDSKGGIMPEPFDPVLSPDGTRMAYEQVRTYQSNDKWVTEGLTGITPLAPGSFHDIINYSDPRWLTNHRVMLGTGSISIYDVDSDVSDYPSTHWFEASDYLDLGDWEWSELADPALSPDGRTMMVTGLSGNQLHWVRVVGDPLTSRPPAPTDLVCAAIEETEPPDGYHSHFENPDYGPESDAAVYEQYGNVMRIDGIEACGAATTQTMIVAGGSDPDWSPVAYAPPSGGAGPSQPGEPAPAPGAPTPAPGATPEPGTQPGTDDSASTKQIQVKGKATLAGKARVGKTLKAKLRVTEPEKVKKKYTWLRNGKKIKGAKKAKLRLTKADRGKKIRVKVTVTARGHERLVVKSKAVRVR